MPAYKEYSATTCDEIFSAFKQSIAQKQQGLFKARSTVSNLGVFHDYLDNAVEEFQVDPEAFDRVNHWLLVQRLHSTGVSGTYIGCIESYLTARKQCVIIGNVLSREIDITSGVRQAQVPFDIVADDLKLFFKVKNK